MLINKIAVVLMTLLIANTTFADSYSKEEKNINFIVTPSIAYRYDVFKWAIPSKLFTDRKSSELIWKNYIVQPSIKIEIEPKSNHFTFLGQTKYGYILKNQSNSYDLDFLNNGTELLYSKTKSVVKGNIFDLSGAVGYSVNLFKNNLLTFYVGYDYSDYRNKDYGSRQLLNYKGIPFSSNELVLKYYFKTQAPWISLSVKAFLNEKFTIIPTIKFYSFKHIGKGYWIHRPDLKQDPSLKNNVNGIGLGFNVDFAYKYSNNLDFILNLETKKFKMKKGQNQAFYSAIDVGGERVVSGKLLHLTHISSSISAGLKYKL